MAKQPASSTTEGSTGNAAAEALGTAANPVVVTQGDAAGAADRAAEGGPAPVIPVPLGGPGAGALHVAEPAKGFELCPLDAESRAADERSGTAARPALDRGGAGVRPYLGGLIQTGGSVLDTAVAVIDADKVGGRRRAKAATQIAHDGRGYRPGETLVLDFAEYTELVSIGAIVATPWIELDREA